MDTPQDLTPFYKALQSHVEKMEAWIGHDRMTADLAKKSLAGRSLRDYLEEYSYTDTPLLNLAYELSYPERDDLRSLYRRYHPEFI